jgi:hypothetical protein
MRRVLVVLTLLIAVLSAALLEGQARLGRIRARPTVSSERTLLSWTNDVTCEGMFKTSLLAGGASVTGFPTAMKVVGATRHYFIFDPDFTIYEENEPTLSACNTASIGDVNANTGVVSWGAFPTVFSSESYYPTYPDTTGGEFIALSYDADTGYLIAGWAEQYGSSDTPGKNSFAAATFGAGSLSLVGCWALNATDNMQWGAGMVGIPAWFVSAHANLASGTKRWAMIGGRVSGHINGSSQGPGLTAIAVPSGNACNSDVQLGSDVIMARHERNNNGPNCSTDIPRYIGCDTSALTPTTPYPAEMAFTGYSDQTYQTEWSPYGGHGWWTQSNNSGRHAWFDNGTKHALISPMRVAHGWANVAISASPAPTLVGATATFTLPSVDTHDGYNIGAGDVMWVQTCTPGSDGPGCVTANCNHTSVVTVTNVNTGTGLVTATVDSSDSGTGDHKPVVGGTAWFGVTYCYGAPRPSRYGFKLQVRNPMHLGEVAQSARAVYGVPYAEEIDLGATVTQLGCPNPACGTGVIASGTTPVAAFADNTNGKIVILFRYSTEGGYRGIGYVFDVN